MLINLNLDLRLKYTAVLAAAAFWTAAGMTPALAADADVVIDNFAFVPATVTIAAGEAVTWTNHDDTPHQVLASDKSFRSPGLDTGEHYRLVFAKTGTYGYYCSLHPYMVGTVIVH